MRKKIIIVNTLFTLVLLGFSILVVLYREKAYRILTPFLLTVPLVYIVKPISQKLSRSRVQEAGIVTGEIPKNMRKSKMPRLPKSVAILCVYLFFILGLLAVLVFLLPELARNTVELVDTLPGLVSGYQNVVEDALNSLRASRWSDGVKDFVITELQDGFNFIESYASDLFKDIMNTAVDFFRLLIDISVAMVISYYIIKDEEHFKELLLSLLPKKVRSPAVNLGREVNRILSGFIQGQLLTALIIGIMETLGLILAGVKYPLALGMIGGVSNIIPYFGPYLGAIPALAIALTDSPLRMLFALIVFITVQQLDNSIISPKIIEGRLGLHPVATIFAVLVGGEFFGIIGMLVAVPIFAILKVFIKKGVDAIAS